MSISKKIFELILKKYSGSYSCEVEAYWHYESVERVTNVAFRFASFARSGLGVPVPSAVLTATTPSGDSSCVAEVVLDSPVGDDAVCALSASLLGRGMGARIPAYKPLKALKLWRTNCGDKGACAIAELLLHGKDDIAPETVEFAASGMSPLGCRAIAESLMLGGNGSLKSLRLDLTPGIGDTGAHNLATGLETCRSLTRLSLAYCDIGEAGAESLARLLSSPLCILETLDIQGNIIGAAGLLKLVAGIRASSTLCEINIADNRIGARASSVFSTRAVSPRSHGAEIIGIDDGASRKSIIFDTKTSILSTSEDIQLTSGVACLTVRALQALGELMADSGCPLAHVDLDNNFLSNDEAESLLQFVTRTNTKLKVLRVEVTLPPATFSALTRTGRTTTTTKPKAAKKK